VGRLIFQYDDGQSLELGVLPGRDRDWYEFRVGDAFLGSNREEFLSALGKTGLDPGLLPR
jgi:hypothetical protein